MAMNFLYPPTQHLCRELPVPQGTVSGDPVHVGDYVGVALTDRGDATRNFDTGNGILVGRASGGIGNADDKASVAVDGVAILPVVGVTSATVAGTPVYITAGYLLTLTGTGNTDFGCVYGKTSANTALACAVEIGV
jgi:predicted RecA/RadA family phage recombinase